MTLSDLGDTAKYSMTRSISRGLPAELLARDIVYTALLGSQCIAGLLSHFMAGSLSLAAYSR